MRRAFVFGLIAVAAACVDLSGLNSGSPDAGADASAPADVSVPDVGVDADLPETSLPPDVDPEGGTKEAGTVDASVVDASGGCCDCDTDSYLADGGACTLDSGIIGFGDCDDGVAALNPAAPFVQNGFWPSSHQPKFDWNCDGVVTKQLRYGLVCTNGGAGNCTGEGFQSDPGCGVEADYFSCQGSLLNCAPSALGKRRQACR